MAAMLVQEGMNQGPWPSVRAPSVMGTAAISNCQPVSTMAAARGGRRLRISVPTAHPTPASKPRAKPAGACAKAPRPAWTSRPTDAAPKASAVSMRRVSLSPRKAVPINAAHSGMVKPSTAACPEGIITAA